MREIIIAIIILVVLFCFCLIFYMAGAHLLSSAGQTDGQTDNKQSTVIVEATLLVENFAILVSRAPTSRYYTTEATLRKNNITIYKTESNTIIEALEEASILKSVLSTVDKIEITE